jgi:hypothetical protein
LLALTVESGAFIDPAFFSVTFFTMKGENEEMKISLKTFRQKGLAIE